MRGLAQLFFSFLLCLGKIKVAASCNECRSITCVEASETGIKLHGNFTITHLTFANGTEVKSPPWNNSISGLEPGRQYIVNFTNSAESEQNSTSCSEYITTKPSPVSQLHVENIGTTAVTLKWNNTDLDASNYTYKIQIDGNGTVREENITGISTVINNLEPGTLYKFIIIPVAADGETEGDPKDTTVYTKPSPVSGIKIEYKNTTTVNLSWKNDDPNASNYTYRIQVEGAGASRNEVSNTTSAAIHDLQPGTLYTFKIYPLGDGNQTEGDPNSTSTYTKPSPVSQFLVENIGTTAVTLKWNNTDLDASNYTYKIQIDGNGTVIEKNITGISTVINNLEPGTLYKFIIIPVAADGETEGDPKERTVYTKPSPVSDIKIEYKNTTTVNLSWKNDDPNASNYTYRIQVEGAGASRNEVSNTTSTAIHDLQPGTLYTFKIYPLGDGNQTEGDPNSTSAYTRPNPVSDIKIEHISNATVTLSWTNADHNASDYTYRIQIKGTGTPRNVSSNTTSAVISDLQPGTLYTFSIYPQVDGGNTEGDPNSTTGYTKPNPVSDIKIEYKNTTTVNLSWKNDDPNASNYTYRIQVEGAGASRNEVSNTTSTAIHDLQPGTLYTFKIYPLVDGNQTEGDPNSTTTYTIPSSVSSINVTDVSTTMVNLSWENLDVASSNYSYRIRISGDVNKNQTSQTTSAEISELNPGTKYAFSIYSVARNNTEGSPNSINHCTNPASVNKLECQAVPKLPELTLNWTSPNGTYEGFRIDVLNNVWNKTLNKEYQTTVTHLNYFTSYTIEIVTHSCGKVSLPQQTTCRTSITDPPHPSVAPTVTGTTHKSLKVQFNSFNSTYGPITAYAIIITTLKSIDKILKESLIYTYNDFLNKKTNTYVAYVKDEQKRSSSSSNSQQHDIEVGDGLETHGYLNGKLQPLGSYRACVAGFTQIAYSNDTVELINVEKSYVSFSPISEVVTLPQNPDVIIGAVVGCILGAVVIAAVVGFIFWKKRRNGGKNNEVPFSPIESKLLKVENFESYFKKQKADSNCGFAEEYEDLRPVGANQPKFAAELPDNKGKNRYNNVLPYDISRVKLAVQNHPTDDYINANYMPGYNSKKEFIAAQGPLPSTVQDFWRMIWEKNIYTIVMLTKCVEQGRTKCEEYWPNKQSKNYGDITVAMTSEIVLPEWTIRDFSMEKSESSESHPVRQFHFTSWPDHGVPETTDLLISFRHLVQEYMKQNPPTSPSLVHCSAGVGRTGTFIAIDRLIHQMEMENSVDVYGVVYDLRMHRSLMVQTEDQYVFLNQCVLDIIKSQKEKKADLIYQNANAMAIYENFTPSPHIRKENGYHV
ncbi:receptor-type tyrosine-protein phosphatase eta [Elgaria multicarinata webbii]|uniref:receptor-type tyrosine-protein phosphatase eta n=1 Tax=Elgaria multicarinata webbii TaxID=159646 RepID=UPI002FCCE677